MRKHGGTPSRRDKHVTLAANSPPGVARGRFVRGKQSGLAGSKPPPLFTRGASSCSSQGRRQGEPWGASPRLSAPTYLPRSLVTWRPQNGKNDKIVLQGRPHSQYHIFTTTGNNNLNEAAVDSSNLAPNLCPLPALQVASSWFSLLAERWHVKNDK